MDDLQRKAAAAGGIVFALAVVLTIVGSSQSGSTQTALYVSGGVCFGIFAVFGAGYCLAQRREAARARSNGDLFLDSIALSDNEEE